MPRLQWHGTSLFYALKDGLTQTFYDSNEDEAYERIDDCLYEPMDDKPVQELQANTPVVGESFDDMAITSCPAYEATTTSFTATGMTIHLSCSYIHILNLIFSLFTSLESIAHQELDETPQNH